MVKDNKNEDENGRSAALVRQYQKRFTLLRQAREHSQNDNIPKAVQHYMKYLGVLASYYRTTEEKLSPKFFDQEKELSELLLISQVYWDLSKSYDRNPKLLAEAERCVAQFTLFTIGFKYQYVNSELIRKFIKKKIAYNPQIFKNSYQQIRANSKKCYIATHCYGEDHINLELLRKFKVILLEYKVGREFVDNYYRFSPAIVQFFERNRRINYLSTEFFIRPLLNFVSRVIRKFIV